MSIHFSESRDPSYPGSATVCRMTHKRLARQILLATPTGRQSSSKDEVADYISDLAWSRLGVDPTKLSEIAADREVFRVFL